MTSLQEREPALAQLLELLRNLPRFDPKKDISELQGDLPAVLEAEQLFHSFNQKYQTRRFVEDPRGKKRAVTVRQPVLQELFKLLDWQNFQKLLSHSTLGRERKRKANQKHRGNQKRFDPEKWLAECRGKRQARLEAWEQENHPELLRKVAEAEAMKATDEVAEKRLLCQVLNELEARYVDRDRAESEYFKLRYRVLLGLFTQRPTQTIFGQLEKLARRFCDDPQTTLKEDLARKLPPIATDWGALEEVLDQSLSAVGENH